MVTHRVAIINNGNFAMLSRATVAQW